ncbi:MAG TPA: hypothetical protein VES20_12790 [Bryobacteraceae bacterium]|nr:hypothetical protein [Bryobacteraceae bacterium]
MAARRAYFTRIRLRCLAEVLAVSLGVPGAAQTTDEARPSVVLESKTASVRVDLGGGSISDFHLAGDNHNPLTWDSARSGVSPRPMGHFLCLDRWGPPSQAEERHGMPFHGEASRVRWRVVAGPHVKSGHVEAEMAAVLPMAGLQVTRLIRLSGDAALFTVTERVTNTNQLGRIYNMVQHPTIAPPFLDEHTLVDSNGTRGFMQSSPLPDPERIAVSWPYAVENGVKVDVRRLTSDPAPNVVSYTIDEEYGWTTATSASQRLLIGYIWKNSDYPWFNAWRHAERGVPVARGLEFGTTGLHQPFPVLVSKGRIFDRSLYAYLDAGETAARAYAGFLFRVPANYQGVANISYVNGQLRLHEHGGRSDRTLTMTVGALFGE